MHERYYSSSTYQRIEEKRRNQAQFLGFIAEGDLITEAVARLGIHPSTYHRWRKNDPEFRSAIDTLRMRQIEAVPPRPETWDGGFVSGRKCFFGFDSYWHQREIAHAIDVARPGEVTQVLVAPETGKTTLLEDYMSLRLGEAPNTRITYVTESQVRTRKICGRLQRRMTSPEYATYVDYFGPFHVPGQERQGKPWAADFFTVWRADHDERDYSFEGRGWRSAVAGTRTDLLLIDDIQSLRSLNQTSDMLDTLRQDFFSRPGRHGKIVVVGTRVGIGDIYEELWEQGIVSEKNTVRLPILNDAGESLCPELWPEADLERRRALVGESAWWRNYMQKPRHSMDATFTEAMISGAYDWRTIGQSSLIDRVCTVDPALAGGCAIGVYAYSAERLEVLDLDYRHNLGAVEHIVAGIDVMASEHHFADLVIETNAYQRGLVEDARLLEIQRRHGFRIRPHATHFNKTDAELGIARMPSAFIRGEITIPGTVDAREKLRPLTEQLANWRADIPTRKRTQDCVMSLWFAWLFWSERRKTMGAGRALFDTGRRLPYAPLGRIGRPLVGVRR